MTASQLPGIYTDLRQCVPRDCAFATVQADEADTVLGTDHAQLFYATEGFHVDELVASQNCDLIIMTGMGGCPYVVCQAVVGSFVAGWGV